MDINKVANAFYENANPIKEMSSNVKWATNNYKKKHGGLWVGGNVSISDNELIFKPNALNQAVHDEIDIIVIPIHKIKSVIYEFGWLTGIVFIVHKNGEFRFRCFSAKKVVNEFNSYIEKL